MTEARATTSRRETAADASSEVATVHLLDVGPQQYGDSILCVFKNETVLIDGAHPGNDREVDGHPSIQDQLAEILGQDSKKLHVSLLMVSHGHDDHIGCFPSLVEKGWLKAEWAVVNEPNLAFGRAATDARPDAQLDERSRQVVAALREEVRSPNLSDAELAEFLSDAVDIEQRYRKMLDTLAQQGTKVVRFGKSSAALHAQVVERFKNIGLELLGPSKAHLAVCAENVLSKRDDAIRLVTDMRSGDASASAAETYRQLFDRNTDALQDAADVARSGNFVNLQSTVTLFKVGTKRFFFAGDMQFIAPGTKDPTIAQELERLQTEIAKRAPFAFFKLCHHGSDNGFDPGFLQKIGGTRYLGICAGSGSTKHPNPSTLDLLKKHKDDLTWARTDHNGRCTFHFKTQKTNVEIERGKLNDAVPNKETDVALPAGPTPAQPVAPPVITRVDDDRTVEVIAKIPHVSTRVTITVDVEPGPATSSDVRKNEKAADRELAPSAGVRDLLFATNQRKLAANIGDAAAKRVVDGLRAAGSAVVEVPAGVPAAAAAAAVRAEIGRNSRIKGVVILGIHDVVPLQSVDALPPSLRRRVGSTADPDNFIVWNDEIYGDADGDQMPELPVSRIPDGASAALVFAALSGSPAQAAGAGGVRNIARPFADGVFERLGGTGAMMTSRPNVFNSPTVKLNDPRVYLMLHGDYTDGSRFWGEETDGDVEAINLSNVPANTRAVIFTGCCWGALTVDRPAGRLTPGQAMSMRRAENSIALAFLQNGARAFIGCTGAHYSPAQEPYNYFGGPMHDAFWRRTREGANPARALFDAKREYFQQMPHGQTKPSSAAIEFKIWRQYTCLGLGW